MGVSERLDTMGEREMVGGGAVLLVVGILILALLTFSSIEGTAFRLVLGIVGVMSIVIGVLSIGISEKSV
jgi:hypothetical protein